ncbi:MAG TPA: ABC transporter ATP-binding protein [Bacillota bacterium]|nr:ABC transporter ATP-binding protein [Bacillota bacterium]HPF42979.1 ABC transporter ATP-binding protein [Bacillota bacterium]HPJ85836.1 ABC transporter ATP-binding protein [Bacillota bacterium]HPQ62151.1 ABC transporter ATP-binding protein [Bacillota bacterium]HRX91894.1 ABC transporter ATP-binding protein [Candidatus Izemoplasmatales bacterium]
MNEPLLKIDDLSVSYGDIEALRDVFLEINQGEYVGIIGPNGGGKSTLMKAILNLVPYAKGNIACKGLPVHKANVRMGYVPQITEMNRLFPISVYEVVLLARLPKKIQPFFKFGEKDRTETFEILKKVGIGHLATRQISDLSGGEFQKMLIARALATNPEILFLDEPTAMIDAMYQKQIFLLLKKLSTEMTIVMITHHVQPILKQITRLIYLDKNVIAEGDPQAVYSYVYRASSPVHRKAGMRAGESQVNY